MGTQFRTPPDIVLRCRIIRQLLEDLHRPGETALAEMDQSGSKGLPTGGHGIA
jgi:hypothetical protein